MKTVGDILKSARKQRNISLDQLAAYTRINKRYLEAIEANDFRQLPAAAFTKGFLHTYATIVGVDPSQVLAIFRRDYESDEKGRIIPRSLLKPLKAASRGVSPSLLTIVISGVVGIIIIGFFIFQIVQFSAAPKLTLNEPSENAVLISPITIRGTTDPLATLTVNNRPILVDPNGNYSTQVQLTQGQHTLVMVAVGRTGKKTSIERVIYIQASP